MEVDFLERYFAGAIEAEHYHARHPEEHDVFTRFHDGSWVEVFKIVTLATKIGDTERPLAGREPGVKSVWFLLYSTTALSAGSNSVIDINHTVVAVDTNFCWNWDAPGNLTRNRPVFNIREPVTEYTLITLGHKGKTIIIKCFKCFYGKWLHIYKPLFFHLRLNLASTLIAAGDSVLVRFVHFYE